MAPSNLITCICALIMISRIATAINYGTQCRQSTCRDERGYIAYHSSVHTSATRWEIMSRNQQLTSFVLHLRNIQNFQTDEPWLEITHRGYGYDSYTISGNEDRIIVFKDTSQVFVRLLRFNYVQFRLDYFTGCNILEGSNVTIVRESIKPEAIVTPSTVLNPRLYYWQNVFSFARIGRITSRLQQVFVPASHVVQPEPVVPSTKCWLVIPTVEEEEERDGQGGLFSIFRQPRGERTRLDEVEETYLTVQNMSLHNESSLNVDDLITGTSMMYLTGNETISVSSLEKNSRKTKYNMHRQISTAVFVDLQCSNFQTCGQTEFTFMANSLQQSDLDCIERERKCKLNIGNGTYNCTPPAQSPMEILLNSTLESLYSTECPAFNRILENVIDNLERDLMSESRNRTERTEAILMECHDYNGYCSGLQCIKFETYGCHYMCFMIKHTMRLCSYFSRVFS